MNYCFTEMKFFELSESNQNVLQHKTTPNKLFICHIFLFLGLVLYFW